MALISVLNCDSFELFYNQEAQKIQLTFLNRQDADLFMQMDFSSKLLSSFVPNEEGIWQPGTRTEYEIMGWPSGYQWDRATETTAEAGTSNSQDKIKAYGELLSTVFPKVKTRQTTKDGDYYQFSVVGNNERYNYSFNGRARVIVALCVLFDLGSHNRNHLEVNIQQKHTKGLKWPVINQDEERVDRFYGDPSKTADVLRNEGWSRDGETPHMFVFRKKINGQQQQMYQIDKREQTLA